MQSKAKPDGKANRCFQDYTSLQKSHHFFLSTRNHRGRLVGILVFTSPSMNKSLCLEDKDFWLDDSTLILTRKEVSLQGKGKMASIYSCKSTTFHSNLLSYKTVYLIWFDEIGIYRF